MAAKPPPTIVVPQPKPKAGKGRSAVFDQYIQSHKALRPYSDAIWKWANQYGIDPVYYAALLFGESGGNPNARSGAGAVGLAQIHLKSHPNVTEAQARNPGFAIKWGAQFFAGKVKAAGGNYEQAYRGKGGYNPGYTGPSLFRDVPKNYVARGSGLSPTESAQRSVETSQAKAQLRPESWAVIGDNGQVKFVKSATQPSGRSFLKDDFARIWGQWNDLYQAYAGRNAKPNEIGKILSKGWSEYTVTKGLIKKPSFLQSPAWKSRGSQYASIAKDIGMKAGKDMIGQAILNNWTGESFAHELRKQPGYVTSNEFKTTEASLGNAYRSIFGNPDDNAKVTIKEAALGGWTADQFAAELRARPEYQQSNEYLTKAGSFFQQLEGILGVRLNFQAAPSISGGPFKAPDDKRVPGVAQPPSGQRLAPTLSR